MRLNRFALKRCVKIIAISEFMKEKIISEGMPAEKIAVIRNWVNIDLIKPGIKDNNFSEKYGLRDKFIILYAGNIDNGGNVSSGF